ncbi:MAG: Type 1 glutamine amidotransferase-like domain-containing protein [Protaetiibacter sp.]
MLLTSSGLTNAALIDATRGLLGGPFSEAKLAVVLTASLVTTGDKSWVLAAIDRLRALEWAGIDLVELNAGPVPLVEDRLRSADVVYVGGGNHYWLAHTIAARGLKPLFGELLATKVYLGESAGSMIFTPLLTTGAAAMQDQAELDSLGIASVEPAVDLFDWYLKPHLGSPLFPARTDEWAAERHRLLGGPAWFIDDDTALLIRDPVDDPEVVTEGRWLRFGDSGEQA